MHDMLKIDTIAVEIVGEGAFKALPPPPPPRIVRCLKYPGSNRVKLKTFYISNIAL